MADLTLFYCPRTRCRTALWMLEEAGADYELKMINVRDDIQNEAFAAINPMRKVPALLFGDELVTETAAICAFLADQYPGAGLAPKPGEAGRGSYMRWLFFGSAVIEPAMFDKASGRIAPAGSIGWGNAERVDEALRKGLEGREYLVNNTFSAADVALGATLGFLMNFNMMEKTDLLQAYVGRLMSRPAAKTAFARDEELAAELEAAS